MANALATIIQKIKCVHVVITDCIIIVVALYMLKNKKYYGTSEEL
jgi:hypothetical protein